MALFKKTAAKKTAHKKVVAAPVADVVTGSVDYAHVLSAPRITEKASMHSTRNVVTFDVATRTNKHEIKKAVHAIYKVTPRMIHIVSLHPKMKRNARTGRTGMTSAGKKAYVYLKEGDTITIG